MPAVGKKSLEEIQRWEVRDILPTAVRLRRRGILTRVLIRTWEKYDSDRSHFLAEWLREQVYDKGIAVEVLSDVSWSFPWLNATWKYPTAGDRITYERVKYQSGHLGFPTLFEDSDRFTYHIVKNCDALSELLGHLEDNERKSPSRLLLAGMFWGISQDD